MRRTVLAFAGRTYHIVLKQFQTMGGNSYNVLLSALKELLCFLVPFTI